MYTNNIPVLVTVSRIVNSEWFWGHALAPGEAPPLGEEPLQFTKFNLVPEHFTRDHLFEQLARVLTSFPEFRGTSVRVRVLSIGGNFSGVLTVYFAQKQPFQYRLQIGFDIQHKNHSIGLIDFWLHTPDWPTVMPVYMKTWYELNIPDASIQETRLLNFAARSH